MLFPAQVLPFLTHNDEDVRRHASDYFGHLADAAPLETAAELWSAIDRYGDHVGSSGYKESPIFLRTLAHVPQNDASIDRAIDLIRASPTDLEIVAITSRIFEKLPIDQIEARRDDLIAVVNLASRSALHRRLSLRSMDVEQLWQTFTAHSDMMEAAEHSTRMHSEEGDRLVLALSIYPDFVVPRAMEILQNPQQHYWWEIWCVELMGALRYAPAADLLIEKIADGEAEVLCESAVQALARINAEQVVSKLESSFRDNDDRYYRMRVAASLEKNKHPLAEECLLRLLAIESDAEVVSALSVALVNLCTTEGLEALRQVILQDRFESFYADVQEEFVMLAKMVDCHPPELEEWTRQLDDSTYRQKRRGHFFEKLDTTTEQMDALRDMLLQQTVSRQPSRAGYQPAAAALPIRREGPKIGRNDPCPCGSGKKYKKCCGA